MKRLKTQLPAHRFSDKQLKNLIHECRSAFEFEIVDVRAGNRVDATPQRHTSIDGSDEDFDLILRNLMSDSNVPLLFERYVGHGISGRLFSSSNVRQYELVTRMAWTAYEAQRQRPIDFMIYDSTPHGLANYITARVRELMGVLSLIIRRTFSSRYRTIVLGIDRHPAPLSLGLSTSGDHAGDYEAELNKAIALVNSTYDDAIPEYERRRLAANNGRIFSLKTVARRNYRRPVGLANTVLSWRTLQRHSHPLSDVRPRTYVAYFLNYQPERTSLPEGWEFAVQYNAVHALRRATPDNLGVLVREHPSTFTNRCDARWRWPGFYEDVARINGVSIVDIREDPFGIIDEAAAVATLTGTVAFEAAARGVPAILLGTSYLPNSRAVHNYRGSSHLREFLRAAVTESDRAVLQQSVHASLLEQADYVFRREEPSQFPLNTASSVDAVKAIARSEDALTQIHDLIRTARGTA